ncbi:ANTAR domain-containing protein [Nocardioides bizhenqiangii]|uniref:ANTAR domain-containing protein n=1 Tax=Nocardioides bizhenqiangii TaxID=3095076 RepID=A0ABZ0ZM33_9ACTN|nr:MULTISPECIES: ANTAR domain-containing protein [unclassified Nocardioides]MDZ5620966.1 ANTAR domain-containing protein [Nocardioides sp. HM23]WQQ25325.1 ANTAR domain-containing protein [Nocardioides sp. HM61]
MPASDSRSGTPRSLAAHAPLRRAVSQRAVVEQAKGILILLYRIDAERAFDVLRDWAKDTDSTVQTVAHTLVHAVCMEDDTREWDTVVRGHVEAAVGRLDGIRLPLPSRPPARSRARLRTVK